MTIPAIIIPIIKPFLPFLGSDFSAGSATVSAAATGLSVTGFGAKTCVLFTGYCIDGAGVVGTGSAVGCCGFIG